MNSLQLQDRTSDCKAPWLDQARAHYCFDEATAQERSDFEVHLLECDFCWQEVQRLDAAIGLLRHDKALVESELTTAVLDSFGISAKLQNRFAGHTLHVLSACGIYAALYAVSVALELAYQFDLYRVLALVAAPLVFTWIFASSCLALGILQSQLVKRRRGSLAWAMVILAGAALLALAGMSYFLPPHPVTQASIQAYTARAAYLKDVVYYFPYFCVFVLVPFHFVLALQRELREGRHLQVHNLLSSAPAAVPPRSTIYPKFRILGGLFVLVMTVGLIGLAHLLDHLLPSPFAGLFQQLIWIRFALFFFSGMEALAWYHLALNEVKREAIVLQGTLIRRGSLPEGKQNGRQQ